MQIFLQYCCNAILKIELRCSSIVKKKKYFNQLSPKFLSPLSHYFYSLLSLPSLFLICSFLSSDPNTIHLPTSTSHIIVDHFFLWVAIRRVLWLVSFFFFFGYGSRRSKIEDRSGLKWVVGMVEVGHEMVKWDRVAFPDANALISHKDNKTKQRQKTSGGENKLEYYFIWFQVKVW